MHEQDPILIAEKQIRAGALAQEIFKRLGQVPTVPGSIDYEVGVVDKAEEYEPEDPLYRHFYPDARFFSVSEGSHFTTDTSNSVNAKIGKALAEALSRSGEPSETIPARICNAINTADTNGVAPTAGDVIMYRRVGGFWGRFESVRIVTIDSTQQEIERAIASIVTS